MKSTMNREYTDLFSVQFSDVKVEAYHRKWYTQFEKNVKHRQQLDVIRRHLRPDTKWLDAPIGSGRVMNSLPCRDKTGFDNSPFFAKYNRAQGVKVVEGDLFDFPFESEFELITTLQTLANFSDFRKVLLSLVAALKPGGVLITDVVNKDHAAAVKAAGLPWISNEGMDRKEIAEFFAAAGCELLEVSANDYYDSVFHMSRYRSDRPLSGKLRRLCYRILNRAYFRLGLYPLFDRLSRGRRDSLYTKYLIVARRK
jgi:SAM-dependent methyltransferase